MDDKYEQVGAAMGSLIEAICAMGFSAAKDVLNAYRDEADPDQADWTPLFIDTVHYAVSNAEQAETVNATGDLDHPAHRFISVAPEPGQAFSWEWIGDADEAFAGMVLRSVVQALGHGDRTPATTRALTLALPVMIRTAAEYLESVMVKGNPETIARAEWAEIAPDLEVIIAAEACIGPAETDPWLRHILDERRWREKAL